jgi:hypothetical protein
MIEQAVWPRTSGRRVPARRTARAPVAVAPPPTRHDGDWPAALLLDEIWLRARRATVHALEGIALWPRAEAHFPLMQQQLDLGNSLGRRLVREILGDCDYRHLMSDVAFGTSNGRLRSRLPYVLAFGFEIGNGLARAYGATPHQARTAGRVCAVFNLGIALFDLTCDSCPELAGSLHTALDERSLRRLSGTTASAPATSGRHPPHEPDVVVLLKLVGWFFDRLRELRRLGTPNGASRVRSLLLRAYRAEMRSVTDRSGNRRSRMRLAREKSTLPFAVMSEIACLVVSRQPAPMSRQRVASSLGRVFWLVDDLADIVLDFQTNALNAVLARAAPEHDRISAEHDVAVLMVLLDGRVIERFANKLAMSLVAFTESLKGLTAGPDVPAHLLAVARSFTRTWLESQ